MRRHHYLSKKNGHVSRKLRKCKKEASDLYDSDQDYTRSNGTLAGPLRCSRPRQEENDQLPVDANNGRKPLKSKKAEKHNGIITNGFSEWHSPIKIAKTEDQTEDQTEDRQTTDHKGKRLLTRGELIQRERRRDVIQIKLWCRCDPIFTEDEVRDIRDRAEMYIEDALSEKMNGEPDAQNGIDCGKMTNGDVLEESTIVNSKPKALTNGYHEMGNLPDFTHLIPKIEKGENDPHGLNRVLPMVTEALNESPDGILQVSQIYRILELKYKIFSELEHIFHLSGRYFIKAVLEEKWFRRIPYEAEEDIESEWYYTLNQRLSLSLWLSPKSPVNRLYGRALYGGAFNEHTFITITPTKVPHKCRPSLVERCVGRHAQTFEEMGREYFYRNAEAYQVASNAITTLTELSNDYAAIGQHIYYNYHDDPISSLDDDSSSLSFTGDISIASDTPGEIIQLRQEFFRQLAEEIQVLPSPEDLLAVFLSAVNAEVVDESKLDDSFDSIDEMLPEIRQLTYILDHMESDDEFLDPCCDSSDERKRVVMVRRSTPIVRRNVMLSAAARKWRFPECVSQCKTVQEKNVLRKPRFSKALINLDECPSRHCSDLFEDYTHPFLGPFPFNDKLY